MTAEIISFKKVEPKCSFCNKSKSQVKKRKLVENGEGQAICMECLERCKTLLAETSE